MSHADMPSFQVARDAGYSEEDAERLVVAMEEGEDSAADEFEDALVQAVINREKAARMPGSLLVVVGGLGIPSIVRVEPDQTWMCVAGIFKGRLLNANAEIRLICREGDSFEPWGTVREGQLVSADLVRQAREGKG